MTKTERYRMEYVNCEVSTIHDDYEKEELCAEEIVDRLNSLNNENEQLKKEVKGMNELLKSYRQTIKHDAKLLADATKNGYLPPVEENELK